MKDLFVAVCCASLFTFCFVTAAVFVEQSTSKNTIKSLVKSCETLNGFTVGDKVYDCKLNREIK